MAVLHNGPFVVPRLFLKAFGHNNSWASQIPSFESLGGRSSIVFSSMIAQADVDGLLEFSRPECEEGVLLSGSSEPSPAKIVMSEEEAEHVLSVMPTALRTALQKLVTDYMRVSSQFLQEQNEQLKQQIKALEALKNK